MSGKDMTLEFGFDIAQARNHLADCLRIDQGRNHFMTVSCMNASIVSIQKCESGSHSMEPFLTFSKAALEQLIDRESRLNTMALELEDQKFSRCRYQQEAKELQNKLAGLNRRIVSIIDASFGRCIRLTSSQAKSAFVAVLIDGDGAKFTEELLQTQEKGGAEAAFQLKEAVREYVGTTDPELCEDDAPIVVKIWANLGGLTSALHKDGSITARFQMSEFAERFSRSRAEFDFVNVGRGKENADSKMRRMFSFYYNNVQCRKIIFAGCHDTGYIHDLQEKQGLEEANQRIVLLETTPAEPQFRQLGFPIIRFDSVFRSTPLDNEIKQLNMPVLEIHPPPGTHPSTTPSPVHSSPSLSQVRPTSEDVHEDQNDEVSRPLSNVNISANGGTSVNYASVGRNSQQQNIVISTSENRRLRFILFNAAKNRLDPPNERSWAPATQTTYNAKLERVKPKALCNDFYLVGNCSWGSSCSREHSQILTSEEVAIHRYRARTGPCTDGPSCRNFDCYSSHHCPIGRRCSKGSACHFSRTYHGDLHFREASELRPAIRWVEGQQFPENFE
jgi:hypothetical protein